MKNSKNKFKDYFTQSVKHVIKEEFGDEDEMIDTPGLSDEMAEGDALAQEEDMDSDAYSDLKGELDSLPEDGGDASFDRIISLGEKYAEYFEKTKKIIQKLQEKQMQNQFEDILKVKFLPLTKQLSTIIDELKAGIADRVQDKKSKMNKEEGGKA